MLAPTWLADGLAVMMLAVSAYCASRLAVARLTHHRTHYSFDAVHTAMGVAMAGMLTSRLNDTTPWIVVFVVAAGWFGVRAWAGRIPPKSAGVRPGTHLRHLVTSAAMAYMLVAVPTSAAASTPGATSMAGPTRFPTVALLLGIFMVGYTVLLADRMSDRSHRHAADEAIFAPRTVACCQVAMNITMGYMLITLL